MLQALKIAGLCITFAVSCAATPVKLSIDTDMATPVKLIIDTDMDFDVDEHDASKSV